MDIVVRRVNSVYRQPFPTKLLNMNDIKI